MPRAAKFNQDVEWVVDRKGEGFEVLCLQTRIPAGWFVRLVEFGTRATTSYHDGLPGHPQHWRTEHPPVFVPDSLSK